MGRVIQLEFCEQNILKALNVSYTVIYTHSYISHNHTFAMIKTMKAVKICCILYFTWLKYMYVDYAERTIYPTLNRLPNQDY